MKTLSPLILLADDDPDDRDFFRSGLKRLYPQIELIAFNDGTNLLDFLANCAASELPDCLLFDYKMPGLMGPDLLHATGPGSRYDPIPKIIWSTTQRRKDIDECLSLGAAWFADKPVTNAELDKLLRSLEPFFYGQVAGVAHS